MERLRALKTKTSNSNDYNSDENDDDDDIDNENENNDDEDNYTTQNYEDQLSDSDNYNDRYSSAVTTNKAPNSTNASSRSTRNSKRNKNNNSESDNFESMLDSLSIPNIDNIPLTQTPPQSSSSTAATTKAGKLSSSSVNNKKKIKAENQSSSSRPKMIHTQKTRVAIEDGKRKTKTFITRTTSHNDNGRSGSQTSDRVRPRTKNVNYHVLVHDKLPNATFPFDSFGNILNIKNEKGVTTTTATAKSSTNVKKRETSESDSGFTYELSRTSLDKYNSDIVSDLEEILRSPIKATPSTSTVSTASPQTSYASNRPKRNVRQKFSFKIESPTSSDYRNSSNTSLRSKTNKKQSATASSSKAPPTTRTTRRQIKQEVIEDDDDDDGEEEIQEDNDEEQVNENDNDRPINDDDEEEEEEDYRSGKMRIKQENQENDEEITDETFKCEMCSAVFSNRAQLLVHVPIHI